MNLTHSNCQVISIHGHMLLFIFGLFVTSALHLTTGSRQDVKFSTFARSNLNAEFVPGRGLRRPRFKSTKPSALLLADEPKPAVNSIFVPGQGLARPKYRKGPGWPSTSLPSSTGPPITNTTKFGFLPGRGLRRPVYRKRTTNSESSTATPPEVTVSLLSDNGTGLHDIGNNLRIINSNPEYTHRLYSLCGRGPPPSRTEELPLKEFGHGKIEIANGEDANSVAWPWMTAIFFKVSNLLSTYWCGGSIIDERTILTAAHCLHQMDPRKYFVRVGDYDLSSDDDGRVVQEFDVEEIIVHEDYVQGLYYNDIAVMKLSRNISFRNHISPVCLPFPDQGNITGNDVYITGWGDIHFAGPSSNILQQATVPVISNDDCERRFAGLPSYQKLFPQGLTDDFICADFGVKNQDACQGDSGGPMVHYNSGWDIVGIVSFGIGCSKDGFAGVYTRVTAYINWISTH